MADFLSRLAARTLGAIPTVQPSIASMFAQGPTGSYPLESWLESESAGDSVPHQASIPVQRSQSTFSHPVPPSPSLMPQSDLSTELPWQPLDGSEDASASTRAIHPHRTIFDTVPLERAVSIPSLPMMERNNLVASIPEAHSSSKEEALSMYPDQPAKYSMYSAPPTSFQNEPRVIRGLVGELRSRPTGTVHTGNDKEPLSKAIESYQTPSGHPHETFLQEGSRSSRRHNGFSNSMHETIVGQEQSTKTQFAPSLHVQSVRDEGEQLIVTSHPHVSETHSSTTQPQRSIAPKVMPSIARNGARTEAQIIEVHAPESTIQVTIGRIEVRATPPPPVQPQSQQHPAPSVMSLDQYLQQRSKGGDR